MGVRSGFRIMASFECGRAVIAGFRSAIGNIGASFQGKVFSMCWEMEEINIPSVSLLLLIDQSDMLNSPPPCCKILNSVGNRPIVVLGGVCVQGGVGGCRAE